MTIKNPYRELPPEEENPEQSSWLGKLLCKLGLHKWSHETKVICDLGHFFNFPPEVDFRRACIRASCDYTLLRCYYLKRFANEKRRRYGW